MSQFYESILCFSIPLLLVQRLILYCYGLSQQYELYRQTFYDHEFRFTCEYEYEGQAEPPGDTTVQDSMLNKREQTDKTEKPIMI